MGGQGSGPRSAPAEVKRARGRSAGRDSGGRKLAEPGTAPPALAVLPGGADRTPDLPDHLEPEGPGALRWARVWRDATWLNTDFDRDSVLRLCEAEELRQQLLAEISADGVMVPGSKGQMRAHPLLTQVRSLEAAMLVMERELGLTPASRSSLSVGERKEQSTSVLAGVLREAAARRSRRA